MRALLYACTTAADLGRTILDEKLPELRRYAGIKGWEVVAEFTDAIPTGIGKRPGFEALCAAIRAGKGEVVVANALSDLCWDIGAGLQRLEALGLGEKVALVCIRNSFDSTNPTGALRLLDAMSLLAEHRRDRARDRQRIGYLRAMAKADGEPIAGRARIAVNPFEIKTLYEKALSQAEMLKALHRLGCMISKGTLCRLIAQAKAAGQLDDAARQAAGEKRGGVPHSGRPRKPAAVAA